MKAMITTDEFYIAKEIIDEIGRNKSQITRLERLLSSKELSANIEGNNVSYLFENKDKITELLIYEKHNIEKEIDSLQKKLSNIIKPNDNN